jgi:hypothetical protein
MHVHVGSSMGCAGGFAFILEAGIGHTHTATVVHQLPSEAGVLTVTPDKVLGWRSGVHARAPPVKATGEGSNPPHGADVGHGAPSEALRVELCIADPEGFFLVVDMGSKGKEEVSLPGGLAQPGVCDAPEAWKQLMHSGEADQMQLNAMATADRIFTQQTGMELTKSQRGASIVMSSSNYCCIGLTVDKDTFMSTEQEQEMRQPVQASQTGVNHDYGGGRRWGWMDVTQVDAGILIKEGSHWGVALAMEWARDRCPAEGLGGQRDIARPSSGNARWDAERCAALNQAALQGGGHKFRTAKGATEADNALFNGVPAFYTTPGMQEPPAKILLVPCHPGVGWGGGCGEWNGMCAGVLP